MGDKIGQYKNLEIFTLDFFPKKKKAQMKLSFGMIFSIMLIIIFIVVAFYAIQKFLSFQDTVKIGQFIDELQSDIDKMWQSSQGSQEVEYLLPSKVDAICFIDDEYENLVFHSKEFIQGKEIKHIDITKITEEGDLCIDNVQNKIMMIIEKNYEDSLITIKKQ